jgi:hypothetical protein
MTHSRVEPGYRGLSGFLCVKKSHISYIRYVIFVGTATIEV